MTAARAQVSPPPASWEDADRAVRRYRWACLVLQPTRSSHPILVREVCGHCGSAARTVLDQRWVERGATWLSWTRTQGRIVCAHCERAWKPVDITERRLPAGAWIEVEERIWHAMRIRRRYGPVFERRPRALSRGEWDQHLVAWVCFLDLGSAAAVAALAAQQARELPPAAYPWTAQAVGAMVDRARLIVTDRLRRRGRYNFGEETRA